MDLKSYFTKPPDVCNALSRLAFTHYMIGEMILFFALFCVMPIGNIVWNDHSYPHGWFINTLFYLALGYITVASIATGLLLIVSGWCLEHYVGRKFSMVVSGLLLCIPFLGVFAVLVHLMVLHNQKVKNLYARNAPLVR